MAALITDEELLQLSLAATAISSISVETRALAISAASDTALSYVRKRHKTPLASVGYDLKRAVAHIAAWDLLCFRGFNPVAGSDSAIEKRYMAAMQWLRDVGKGNAELDVVDASPTVEESAPLVSSGDSGGTDWPIFGHGWEED